MKEERQVDLPQLFADVTRTVSGIRSLMGHSTSDGTDSTAASPSTTDTAGGSSIFGGNVCFKACGMEDIQLAARAAAELLHSARLCLLISTTVGVLCLVLLTALVFLVVCSRLPSPRLPTPSLVHSLFPSSKHTG